MKRVWIGVCLSLLWVGLIASAQEQTKPNSAARSTAKQMALEADGVWLDRLDAGQYEACWNMAAAPLKAAVTEEKWESVIKGVMEPMGKLRLRTLQSATYTTILPGAPDGEYVMILYESSFEHKQTAQETVIVSREKDKAWRVAGYYIK